MTQVGAVLFDFSKAFDKGQHHCLVVKHHHNGTIDESLFWIQSFLADRNQQVVLDRKTSPPAAVTFGVPQATVLRTLFFLVNLNNLPAVKRFLFSMTSC